jgi:hypothetical protein
MLEKKINQKRDCRAPRGLAMTSGMSLLKTGSALIMTVVLVVLLSIVAVMFVMVARMDSASTSNIVDSKTLDNAAQSIIEIISKELVFDTPGVAKKAGLTDPNYLDYQDYPDVNDAWLASIEPYGTDKAGVWRQISDVTGYLRTNYGNPAVENINVKPEGILYTPDVVRDYPEFGIDGSGKIGKVKSDGTTTSAPKGVSADADGDGIADSKWIELADLNSSKGKKVFAAIRIIDNCAMLNVNTAYKFDADTNTIGDRYKIDGTSQLQVNLRGLLKTGDNIEGFVKARCGGEPFDGNSEPDWNKYDNDVIWQYGIPDSNTGYLPFDISDELELRYRYCIDSKFVSRIEANNVNAMPNTTRGDGTSDSGNLYNGDASASTKFGLEDWQHRMTEPDYNDEPDRRHLLTTYSFDRIIDPDGNKMFNVRSDHDAQSLYERLVGGGTAGAIDMNRLGGVSPAYMNYYLAQIAANIIDYGDDDSNVSVVEFLDYDFYGYEPPFIFISEIARNFQHSASYPADTNVYCSYAVELYKNFDNNDIFTNNWRLKVGSENYIYLSNTDFNLQGGQYYVRVYENVNALIKNRVDYTDSPQDGAANVSRNVTLRWPVYRIFDPCDGNSYNATSYKIYIGTSKAYVESRPAGAFVETAQTYYKPDLSVFTLDGTKVFWCVDAFYNGLLVKSGNVWEFTIGTPVPASGILGSKLLANDSILLEREVGVNTNIWITVDSVGVPDEDIDMDGTPDFIDEDETELGYKSFQRDMRWNYYLKGLWCQGFSLSLTLGCWNDLCNYGIIPEIPPWHNSFTTIGDAAMVFREGTYLDIKTPLYIRMSPDLNAGRTESEVRFDVYCPSMQNVFKYITALNPDDYASNDANETRVRGRVNINTAPAFVIAQLPWVSRANWQNLKIADAIVAYRDMTDINGIDYSNRQTATGLPNPPYVVRTEPGFSSIGELMNVINGGINGNLSNNEYDIRYCGIDLKTQYGYPGLYGNDLLYNPDMSDTKVQDDLEEKEVIFSRISDLATVRSDTFTAYILVRVGVDGPQKRFIAILDRTGVNDPNDKVKVAAFQQVPAAR